MSQMTQTTKSNDIALLLNFPETGEILAGNKVLETDTRYKNSIFKYRVTFDKDVRRSDIPNILREFFNTGMITIDGVDHVVENHDYQTTTTRTTMVVKGTMQITPLSLTNPVKKKLTALEDFDNEYDKMVMTSPETYFRAFSYRGFDGPSFRSKLFSFVSTMGENYGYCNDKTIYHRRASLVMPKIKITKAPEDAKMFYHTHPKRDEPSLSSADDYLLYFDMSHKPRNIRHFYTVMADRMDYFHIVPKPSKKKDYVKINEDKFIEELDTQIDQAGKRLDEVMSNETYQDDLVYCEKVTREVVKWLNKKYGKYFTITYKCHYKVKKNPEEPTGDDLHLGDEFIGKALKDLKTGDASWPDFGPKDRPQEKYAYWHSKYFTMNKDVKGVGYMGLLPGDDRRLTHFLYSSYRGSEYTYDDLLSILCISNDIKIRDNKIRDGKETSSRIEDILDYLEINNEEIREDIMLYDAVVAVDAYGSLSEVIGEEHNFILPIADFSIKSVEAMDEVRSGKKDLEQAKYDIMFILKEKMAKVVADALGKRNKQLENTRTPVAVYGQDGAAISKAGVNPPVQRSKREYKMSLPSKIFDNPELLSEILEPFKKNEQLRNKNNAYTVNIPVDNSAVTFVIQSTGTVQVFSPSAGYPRADDPDEATLQAVRKLVDKLNEFGFEIDTSDIAFGTIEPMRNPRSGVIVAVTGPIRSTKNKFIDSLSKRMDAHVVTTFTTKTLKEYEKKSNIVEVTDEIFDRMEINGELVVVTKSYNGHRRGFSKKDMKEKDFMLVDARIKDLHFLINASPSVISFYLHPTNTEAMIESYLLDRVSPQEAKRVAGMIDDTLDAAEGEVEHIIEYDIERPAAAIEEVYNTIPKPNPMPKSIGSVMASSNGEYYLRVKSNSSTADRMKELRDAIAAKAHIAALEDVDEKLNAGDYDEDAESLGMSASEYAEKMKEGLADILNNPSKKISIRIDESTNPEKKLMAVFTKPNGRTKTIHFGARGMSDYTQHKDKDRMKNYLARHGGMGEDWNDPMTAGALSRWILWGKPSLRESFNDFKKRFNMEGVMAVTNTRMNPPFTYDLMSTVRPRAIKEVDYRLFPKKTNGWDKRSDKQKERLIQKSKKFRRELEYAYGWKGKTAKTAIEAILADYAKSFDKNGYAKVYRGLITLPSENLEEVWDKYGVGASWSSYKEGADDYMETIIHDMPGAVLVLVEGRVHIEEVASTTKQLTLRIGFPLEKEIRIGGDIEVTKYSIWRIDTEDRVKKPKWETTGKNWKPWLRRGIKPLKVVEVNQSFPAFTSASEPTPLPNPNQDYYAIIDGKPVYPTESNPRIPKKYEGQDPSEHSDLYTDEDPKGTIQGLGFKDAETAKKSIRLIKKSGKTHAHKIQAAMAMEQRARFHPHATKGIKDAQKIYAEFIEEMKKKTKRNPSHCPIEAEARRAATDPSFKHHKWYVKHHLDYVMAIMKRMPKVMGNWDKQMVDMVWMHDYPKMMGKGQDLSVVDDLLTTHRGEDYAYQVVHQLHLMERLKKSDWNPLTEYSMVAANLSTADALAHYYGPFFQIYIDENPDMSMEEIKKSNRQKLAKDKLKLRAGPMKDGLDSIKFQYKGRKVRILGNEHIKALIEKKNPSKTPEGRKIPKKYLKGLNKEEMAIAAKEIDKGYKYDIDDPKAYEYWKSDIQATARGYKTVPSKYKKKFIQMYGPLPEEGKFLDKMAKATKIKKSILEKVYDKGLAAWRGGHRPGVQQHQWAAGRVYSFVTLGNTVKKGKKKMPDYSLAIEAGIIKDNPPSFIAARDPKKWAKRYDRIIKMSGKELMEEANEQAAEKGLKIEFEISEPDIKTILKGKTLSLPTKYEKLYEKYLRSRKKATISLIRGKTVVDKLDFRLIEEAPKELLTYLESRKRWTGKKYQRLPRVMNIVMRQGRRRITIQEHFVVAGLQRKEKFPIAIGGSGGYEMSEGQQGKGYYGIIKTYQAGFLEDNGIEAFGAGESPMRSDLYQSYGWLTAYSYKENYPYPSAAAEYYLNLNKKDKLPNKAADYWNIYRPVYSGTKSNPPPSKVIIVSGPSGSGKSTISKTIAKELGGTLVPTVTTRSRRPKEKEGEDRIFVSKDEFKEMIDNNEFVEYKQHKDGVFYGRRKTDMDDISIVEVSLKGMKEYKELYPDSFAVFLEPDKSPKEIEKRLLSRGGMSEANAKARASIIPKQVAAAKTMPYDLFTKSRTGKYSEVAKEIISQIPMANPGWRHGEAMDEEDDPFADQFEA